MPEISPLVQSRVIFLSHHFSSRHLKRMNSVKIVLSAFLLCLLAIGIKMGCDLLHLGHFLQGVHRRIRKGTALTSSFFSIGYSNYNGWLLTRRCMSGCNTGMNVISACHPCRICLTMPQDRTLGKLDMEIHPPNTINFHINKTFKHFNAALKPARGVCRHFCR